MQLEQFRNILDLDIRWADMDAVGHVNNATYLTYYECGRTSYGDAMAATIERSRSGGVVAEINCRYLRQLRFPARIRVCTRVSRIGNTSFDYSCAIYLAEDSENPVSTALVRMVCFDQKSQQKYRMPDDVRAYIRNYEKITPEMEPGCSAP